MIMFMHMEHNHEFRLGRPNIEKSGLACETISCGILCFLFIALTPRVYIYTEFFHPKLGKGEMFISMILNHNK